MKVQLLTLVGNSLVMSWIHGSLCQDPIANVVEKQFCKT